MHRPSFSYASQAGRCGTGTVVRTGPHARRRRARGSAEVYARMMSGKAQFPVVLTM